MSSIWVTGAYHIKKALYLGLYIFVHVEVFEGKVSSNHFLLASGHHITSQLTIFIHQFLFLCCPMCILFLFRFGIMALRWTFTRPSSFNFKMQLKAGRPVLSDWSFLSQHAVVRSELPHRCDSRTTVSRYPHPLSLVPRLRPSSVGQNWAQNFTYQCIIIF